MEVLKKIGDNFAALLKVKTIVTLVVTAVFAYLSVTGTIIPDKVEQIVMIVIAFYFGTQHEKKG